MLSRSAIKARFPAIAHRFNSLPFLLTSFFAVYVLFSRTIYAHHLVGDRVYFVYGTVAALALCGAHLSYAQATLAYRILTRSAIAFATFYVVTGHIEVAGSLLHDKPLSAFELNDLWIGAALAGLIGFFRPSFGLIPLLYVHWQKQQLMYVLGTPIEWMDYFTLIETGSFLILGYLLYAFYGKLSSGYPGPLARTAPEAENGTIHAIDILVLLAVALHFGNYFYAGWIKANLGDNPVDWILNNRTELLVLAAWDSFVLPVSFHEPLAAASYEIIANVKAATNLATIAIQLLAVVAIVRLRWAILITLSYDVLHLIIFVTTGIFFWKFIILNLAIVAALSAMALTEIPRKLKFMLAPIVVCSPFVFQIMPSFAWLDTPAVNQVRLYAVTEDGVEYLVPSNYFLGASVNFAQNRWVWPEQGPYPTQTWGTTRDNAVAKAAQSCDWQPSTGEMAAPPFGFSRPQIETLVRHSHQQILSMVDDNGYAEYDLFPHHIFSMPWYFEDFKKLDKRRIVSFRYESQAVCLGYHNGQITRQTKFKATFDIPL